MKSAPTYPKTFWARFTQTLRIVFSQPFDYLFAPAFVLAFVWTLFNFLSQALVLFTVSFWVHVSLSLVLAFIYWVFVSSFVSVATTEFAAKNLKKDSLGVFQQFKIWISKSWDIVQFTLRLYWYVAGVFLAGVIILLIGDLYFAWDLLALFFSGQNVESMVEARFAEPTIVIFNLIFGGIAFIGFFIFIYRMVVAAFATVFFAVEKKEGKQAIASSRALTKGRWWNVFLNVFGFSLLLGLLIGIVSEILVVIIVGIIPDAVLENAFVEMVPGEFVSNLTNPLGGMLFLFRSFLENLFVGPLALFLVLFYRSIEDSQATKQVKKKE